MQHEHTKEMHQLRGRAQDISKQVSFEEKSNRKKKTTKKNNSKTYSNVAATNNNSAQINNAITFPTLEKETATKMIACMMHAHLINAANPGTYNSEFNRALKLNNLPPVILPDNPPSLKILNLSKEDKTPTTHEHTHNSNTITQDNNNNNTTQDTEQASNTTQHKKTCHHH